MRARRVDRTVPWGSSVGDTTAVSGSVPPELGVLGPLPEVLALPSWYTLDWLRSGIVMDTGFPAREVVSCA